MVRRLLDTARRPECAGKRGRRKDLSDRLVTSRMLIPRSLLADLM